MGCCFCCLNEGDKVERVLYKFPPYPVSQAADGALQKLVGRVVLAGSAPFYSPCENRPCVYFHVTVDEEVIRHRTRRDPNGNEIRETYHDWQRIVSEERFVDFYLQDGQHKLFVNGSNRGLCRIQGTRNASRSNYFHAPPPGVQQLIWASNRNWRGWGYHNDRTGRFRYSETTFDVNELVACLGVVTPAVDPYTRAACKILSPVNENALNEQFFLEHKWSDWDRRSWHDLCQRPAVLLSDNQNFTGGVQVMPVMGLPQYMLVYMPTQVDMYGAGPGFQPYVPVGGAPGGMPGGYPGGMPGGGMPGGYPGGGMPGGGMGGMPGGGMGGMPGGGMPGGGMPGGAPGGMPMGYSTMGDPSMQQGMGNNGYRKEERQPLLS